MLLCPYASVKYTGAISNLQNRVYFFEFGEKGPHSSEILIHRKNVAYLSPILYFYYSRKILIRVFSMNVKFNQIVGQ